MNETEAIAIWQKVSGLDSTLEVEWLGNGDAIYTVQVFLADQHRQVSPTTVESIGRVARESDLKLKAHSENGRIYFVIHG